MNPLVVAKPTSVFPAAVTGFITGSSLNISLEQQFLESQRAHISPLENKFANTYMLPITITNTCIGCFV